MSDFHLLGRQPILDTDRKIFAYDLLFRDEKKHPDGVEGRYASVTVLTNVMNQFGAKEILGKKKAFVRIDRDFLFNDLLFDIPRELFVFAVMPEMPFNMEIARRIVDLRRRGFEIALNDAVLDEELYRRIGPLFPHFKYIKVDMARTPKNETFHKLLDRIKKYDSTLVASKVETPEMTQICENLGFQYFQGYFFAKPQILKQQKLEPHYRSVIHAYNLLISNADVEEIAGYLEQHSALSLQLLRYVNSAAFSLKRDVKSIQEVIVLLGRHNLAQWLMMIIYAQSMGDKGGSSTLALLAKSRMELMRRTWQLMHPEASKRELDEAYFVGALSLLDVVMKVPMEEILEEFNISRDVRDAILKGSGKFGRTFLFVKSIEECNEEAVDLFLNFYRIGRNGYDRMIEETAIAVNRLDEELENY
ncbi:HDOD domain-containing protein [Hydrogenimonas sp. SS33]|uniref:EAL and HDOD domain-containing protein n=1 Tax=Hydrogenimonas leucolamina TaxID=2954236 RepID=UPI00336C0821